MTRASSETIYLRWGPRRNRGDDFAEQADAELVYLRWQSRQPLLAGLRYVVQCAQTFGLLVWKRPTLVISQHTQPFCSLAAVAYCRLFDARCVNDCHNAPFVDRLWNLWPLKQLSICVFRASDVNLVHNEPLLRFIESELRLPGRFTVLEDPIPSGLPVESEEPMEAYVVAICSFAPDEPVGSLLEACATLPGTKFLITGDPGRMAPQLADRVTPNVEFTGFVSNDDYDRLLSSARVAVALSTREHVLMRAHYEAVAAHLPLVTSDNPAARGYLSAGTVFAQNDGPSIASGIRRALHDRDHLEEGMRALKRKKHEEWQRKWAAIRRSVAAREAPHARDGRRD